MSVSSINNDSIGTSLNQSLGSVESIDSNTNSSRNTQTTFLVLACHWLVLSLCDILISNQTYKMVCIIHNRKFLNLVLLKNLSSCCQVGLLMGSNKILRSHHLIYLFVEMTLETQVTICYNTNQMVFVINNRNTTNMIVMHHIKSILHCASATNSDWIVNHSILGTLYNGHLACLLLNRHVLVDNTDTSLTSYGYGHRRLGNSIHSGCYEWNVQLDITRELGFQLYLFRQYL